MYKAINVQPLEEYKIWIEYANGVSGEADLSHLVGKGVFKYWDNYENFKKVHVGKYGEIAWSDEIDLCPDSLYMQMTGKTVEELFGEKKMELQYA